MAATRKNSTADSSTRSDSGQALLVFPVADKWFALPLESVRAVVTANLLQPLLGGLDDLAGWLDVHGQEVLVLDMSRTLVPGASKDLPQQIILLRVGELWAGLSIAGTSETVNVPAEQMQEISEMPNAPRWAMWTCRSDKRTITVLDPDQFAGDLCLTS